MPDSEQQLPPAAVIITHPVADFDTWKAGFDAHEQIRRDAGTLGHHINRAADNPNLLSIYLAVSDIDRARAFTESDELKAVMQDVGVTGAPEFTWMTPEREAIVWEQELPAVIVSHTVADFDAWLDGYDAADDLRRSKGIVGHAANRSVADPSLAVVYHQAESFDTLRQFLDDPRLKSLMGDAGVTSPPETSFYTGGWAKQYT